MPSLPGPSTLLRKAKVFLTHGRTDSRSAEPPKPTGAWLRYFSEAAEELGIKTPGYLEWALDLRARRKLLHFAASNGQLEVIGFFLCGMHYLKKPRNAALARGIKTVFLTLGTNKTVTSGSPYTLNLTGKAQQNIDKLLSWNGYNDISGILDIAGQDMVTFTKAGNTIGEVKQVLKSGEIRSESNQKLAGKLIDLLAKGLQENGWTQNDLREIGLL